MVVGAPLEDARHLAQRYSRMRQEAEAQVNEQYLLFPFLPIWITLNLCLHGWRILPDIRILFFYHCFCYPLLSIVKWEQFQIASF